MSLVSIRWTCVLLSAALALAAACSDDGPAEVTPTDQGVVGKDSKTTGKDGKVPGKDGNKPNPDKGAPNPGFTGWRDLPGKGPLAGGHTATLLQDGRVLMAGGLIYESGSKGSAKAWLYNPANQSFNPVADLKVARGGHRAVLLNDGKVLIMGGRAGSSYNPLAEAELFDPKTKTWTKVADMPGKRSAHSAVKLASGKVLVVGGYGGNNIYYDSFVMFDPKSKSWVSPALTMKYRRSAADATLLPGGKLVISGGWGGTGSDSTKFDQLDSVEIYDTVKITLSESKGKMVTKRAGHQGVLLNDGRVMLVGGYCGSGCKPPGNELYDPVKDQVVKINHQGTPPSHMAVVKLNDGKVLVIGGSFSDEKKVALFEPKGLFWKSGPSLKHGRFDHTATLLNDGRVLVAGGKTGSPSDLKAPIVGVAELSNP